MTFCCLRFGVEKEGGGVRSIDQSRSLIGDKIKGFDRAIGVRVGERFEGFVGCFFRRCEVISHVNISAAIRLNPRAKLYRSSLGGAP